MIDAVRPTGPDGLGAGVLPAGVGRRVQGMLAEIAAEDGVTPSVLWLAGAADAGPPAGQQADVVVAHDVVPRAQDPRTAMAQLLERSRRHLIVSAPREPLARVGIHTSGLLLGGRRRHGLSAPDLVRLASTVGAVRAIRLPWLWTVLWVRRR